MYVPAGSTMPGSSTFVLNVKYVSLFQSSAFAAGATKRRKAAAAAAIKPVEIIRFMLCLTYKSNVRPGLNRSVRRLAPCAHHKIYSQDLCEGERREASVVDSLCSRII